MTTQLQTQWVVGFVDGEGCFHIGISHHSQCTLGYQVLPEFTVVQHSRDVQVLHALKTFFGCGVVRRHGATTCCYRVRHHTHLQTHIVPFFEKHPLRTKKRLDFIQFRRVLLWMDRGDHLTPEGLARIRNVQGRMNTRVCPEGRVDL